MELPITTDRPSCIRGEDPARSSESFACAFSDRSRNQAVNRSTLAHFSNEGEEVCACASSGGLSGRDPRPISCHFLLTPNPPAGEVVLRGPTPPKPTPVVEKPDPRAAEIALKAKQEEERRKKAEAERKAEAEKKAREAKEAEDKRKLEEKRAAEAKERQQREMAAMRAQAEREAQQLRAQAEREAQVRAQQAADAAARSKAEADWIRRIQAKVKGNVIVPADLPGNPEAIFEVVQLPTGEIIDTRLVKSSGSRAYDDAVQRAILKSSPLPRPERAELFQRALTLKFRPQD